ncbi:efflux RND transporter periplasmic adaptor subunit [Acidocella sp.]|uniref:efflux RND transporter periplasmic adaptor subunit n=1 Tax=Acidocella sp. TaxID=50710 RepID=UPI002F418EA9
MRWPTSYASSLLTFCALSCLGMGTASAATSPDHPSVPVVVQTLAAQNLPIEVDAIGHVEALNNVEVRPQVSGQLLSFGFQEGQEVKAGQVIARIDPQLFETEVAEEKANILQDKASLDNEEMVATRAAPLFSKGLVSAQALQADRAQVAVGQAKLAADQAVLSRDNVELGYTTITSPINGIAGLQEVTAGNIVTPQEPSPIVTITQEQPISALFPFPAPQLLQVQQAMAAAGSSPLTVEAWSQSGNVKLDTGTLEAIDNQISPGSGMVTMKAVFPNKARLLWPGEFINLKIILRVQHDAVAVPLAAIQRGPDGTYVWTVAPNGTAHQAAIAVAESTNGQAVISSGLEPGERVVTNGQFALVNGAHTQILAPGTTSQDGTALQNAGTNQVGIAP